MEKVYVHGAANPRIETAKEQNRGSYYNARNNARCTQAIKTTHSLDRQHQDADRTPWKSQSE